MLRTPRKVFAERARTGSWGEFPVSPAEAFSHFTSIAATASFDGRGTALTLRTLEMKTLALLELARTDAEVLAVHRAVLGACVDEVARGDESGDDLGSFFREQEELYLARLPRYADRPGILRDLVEFATWEDYRLFTRVASFLAAQPRAVRDLANAQLAALIADLAAADFEYAHRKATRLRAALGAN